MVSNLARKVVIVLVLCLGIFVFSVISVDERQNAVVVNQINQHKSILPPGLHFVWPLLEQVNYVYMNQHSAMLTVNLTFPDNTNVEVNTVVQWQVVNPLIYFNLYSTDEFSRSLANKVMQIVASRVKTTNLSTFNQLSDLISEPLVLTDLGVVINKISPNELKVIAVQQESAADLTSPADSISVESAYYQAQMIKTQTEIDQAKMYQQLASKNAKFYAYFRKLQIYKDSAKSKQDMPPLEDLYK